MMGKTLCPCFVWRSLFREPYEVSRRHYQLLVDIQPQMLATTFGGILFGATNPFRVWQDPPITEWGDP